MRYSSILILLFYSQIGLGQNLLDTRIDFVVEDKSISEALLLLSQQSKVDLGFSKRYFNRYKKVSLSEKSRKIAFVLDKILEGTNVGYKVEGGQVLLYKKPPPQKKRYTISGYVEDAKTGERLVSATVFCKQHNVGTLSNEYGFYSLTLPEGELDLSYSYLGSGEVNKSVQLTQNTHLEVEMETSILLAEVVVIPNQVKNTAQFPASRGDQVQLEQLKALPDLGGESDVFRMIQMLPGVQTGADGYGGMTVRGGSSDQNLILLDGVPIYNATHLLGQYSIFNSDAIRSVKLLKGGFPARYAGRLSSVLDIRTREGNQKRWSANGGIGLVSGNLTVEGPFANKKGTILVTARQTLSDFYLKRIYEKVTANTSLQSQNYQFYDLNAKVSFEISKKDRLFFSYYRGGDFFIGDESLDEDTTFIFTETELNWGNNIFSLRWNHLYNEKLFSNLTLNLSKYQFEYKQLDLVEFFEFEEEEEDFYSYGTSRTDIRDYSIRMDFNYLPNNKNHLRFGFAAVNHDFTPFTDTATSGDDFNDDIPLDSIDISDFGSPEEFNQISVLSFSAYLENEIRLNNGLLDVGLHASSFLGEYGTYFNVEPRLALQLNLNDEWNTTSKASRMVQYLHLLSTTSIRLPGDVWYPSVDGLEPQKSWQGSLGVNYAGEQLVAGAEFYGKLMNNLYLLELDDQSDSLDLEIEDDLYKGKGWAYGLDFYLRKDYGKTGGWLSYSYSWAWRQYNARNLGNKFAFSNDRRHNLKLFLFHKINPNWTLGAQWVYGSPNPIILLNDSILGDNEETFIDPGGQHHSSRAKANHRLDLSLSYRLQGKKLEHTFKASFYNVYNRQNPAFYRLNPVDQSPTGVNLVSFLPSLYWGIRY